MLYSEYTPFDPDTPTEEILKIVQRRRLMVTKLLNQQITEIMGDEFLPFNVPKTSSDGMTRFFDHYHAIIANEERSQGIYRKYTKV